MRINENGIRGIFKNIIYLSFSKRMAKRLSEAEKPHVSKVVGVLLILGAILIGIGIILLVASNWQRMPSTIKLILLFTITIATYIFGWKLKFNSPKLGSTLLFLASIFVGATIFLTAQIFNFSAGTGFHLLLLLWFIAIAPLSYAFDSLPILVLSLLVFTLWMMSFIGGGQLGGIASGFQGSMLTFLFYGITLYGVGYLHTAFSRFKIPYQAYGLFFYFLSLYILLISNLYGIFDVSRALHWMFYVFFIGAILTVAITPIYITKGLGRINEFVLLIFAFLGGVIVWLISVYPQVFSSLTTTILLNVIFFLLTILAIFSGYYMGAISVINIGMFFFVLYLFYFYFTTVFVYLEKSLALIIGGIILLVLGWYLERTRKYLVGGIKNKP